MNQQAQASAKAYPVGGFIGNFLAGLLILLPLPAVAWVLARLSRWASRWTLGYFTERQCRWAVYACVPLAIVFALLH
jgi:uncharacterized membrane protein